MQVLWWEKHFSSSKVCHNLQFHKNKIKNLKMKITVRQHHMSWKLNLRLLFVLTKQCWQLLDILSLPFGHRFSHLTPKALPSNITDGDLECMLNACVCTLLELRGFCFLPLPTPPHILTPLTQTRCWCSFTFTICISDTFKFYNCMFVCFFTMLILDTNIFVLSSQFDLIFCKTHFWE